MGRGKNDVVDMTRRLGAAKGKSTIALSSVRQSARLRVSYELDRRRSLRWRLRPPRDEIYPYWSLMKDANSNVVICDRTLRSRAAPCPRQVAAGLENSGHFAMRS